MIEKNKLPDFDGTTAFNGGLRFFDSSNDEWKQIWGKDFGSLMPEIKIFAADAFGTIYGLDSNNEVVIFWPETAELESLEVGVGEFYEMIAADPVNTINLDLFNSCVEEYGRPLINENFAFKIETALGGELSVGNISIMNAADHYKLLGKIAAQIKDIPEGTIIDNLLIEKIKNS